MVQNKKNVTEGSQKNGCRMIVGELVLIVSRETGTTIDLSGQPVSAYLIGLMLEEYKANWTAILE